MIKSELYQDWNSWQQHPDFSGGLKSLVCKKKILTLHSARIELVLLGSKASMLTTI